MDSASTQQGPCAVSARPLEDGKYEIRLSYLGQGPRGLRLDYLPFISTQKLVIDHWLDVPKKKVVKAPVPVKAPIPLKTVDNEIPSAQVDASTLANNFDNQSSWDKILGSAAVAMDFNSPELDRFRQKSVEKSLGISKEPIELKPLALPLLDLPLMESPLTFAEEKPRITPFTLDRPEHADEKALKEIKGAEDGMNVVRILADKGEWLKAREAMDILGRSRQAKWVPQDNAKWWSLQGIIYMKLGRELKDRTIVVHALDLWRDGLKKSGGWGGESQEHIEFMAQESIRNLFNENLVYGAASLLSWARRYSWSAAAEERFDFLRGEAFYKLGLYEEAREAFGEFVTARKDIPVNSFADRRLVSAAAYRLGDLEMRIGDMNKAIEAYTRAFVEGPRVRKFSFEGNWLPEDVKIFPYALFNRAEAQVRIGHEDGALKDLRAFLFVSPSHPESGLVYYRIGDLLFSLGADREKAMGAWRECIFKVPKTPGGRLCLARKSAEEMSRASQEKWPSLIADIEDAMDSSAHEGEESLETRLSPDELKVYLNLLLADAFLRVDRPYQALLRLDPLWTLNPSPYLKTWYHEYLVTAVIGSATKNIEQRKFREVVKDYQKRRKTLFLYQTRSEALWNLARAYQGLHLLPEALESLEAAERVRDRLVRKELRPYEPNRDDWIALRAEIQTELIASGDKNIDPGWVRIGLEKLDESQPKTQRLWIRIAKVTGNADEEAKWYSKLEGSSGLTWPELSRYTELLAQLKKTSERRDVIERRVGSWFGEREKVGNVIPPPSLLLMDLFEARASSGAIAEAVAVADYLSAQSDDKLGPAVTKPMIAYKKGELLRKNGRPQEARQSFERAKVLAPDSVWGKLSASAQKEMSAGSL